MRFYHSTIKVKLDEILASEGLMPGKESPEEGAHIAELMFLGQYHKPSQNQVYLWKSFEKADACARFTSSKAKFEYDANQRKPIVIEVELNDCKNISPDPNSTGVMHYGLIPKNNFLMVYELF